MTATKLHNFHIRPFSTKKIKHELILSALTNRYVHESLELLCGKIKNKNLELSNGNNEILNLKMSKRDSKVIYNVIG